MYLIAFPLAYALAVFAGRATRLGGGEVALVWPAAAVAVIWLLATRDCRQWERLAHLLLLGATTFLINLVTGATLALSAWFVLVNMMLAVVTVWLLTSRRSDVALRDPADLAQLVGAVAGGSCAAAAVATAYLGPATQAGLGETFALFAVRNGTSALLGVALYLRVQDIAWTRPKPDLRPRAVVEALLTGAGVVSVFLWNFWLNTGIPMAFLALVPATWVALRYSTTVSTVFLMIAGVWITFSTLSDRGSLIVADVQNRALLSQAMVCSLTIVVLALALFRDSRARLISELKLARDEADRDSELFEAVLDSIHDSVILVDAAGAVVLQNAQASGSGLADEVIARARWTRSGETRDAATHLGPRDVVVAEDDHVVEVTTAPLAQQSNLTVMAFRDVTDERAQARALREARDLFAGVLHAASEQAIVGTDPTGHITVFNHGAERLLGWTEDEMLGRELTTLHLASEIRSRARDLGVAPGFGVLVHKVAPSRAEVREWTFVRRDGTRAAVSLAVSQMTGDDGRCTGYIGVATDITEQQAAELALMESEERFRLAFDTAPMGMFLFEVGPDRSGRITRCNQAMADILGVSTAGVLQLTIFDLGGLENHGEKVGLEQLAELDVGDRFDAEAAFRRTDGSLIWGAVSASVVAPQGSRPYGIGLVEDITSRKRAEAELQHLALHDGLTGLANRVLFMDRIERAMVGSGRDDTRRVGLIFLDLDGFKTVNDTWGHAQGDEVLKVVATRIEESIRVADTAARLGGDEFAVLCPDVSSLDQLQRVAERIRDAISRPVDLADGVSYNELSASAGVVMSRREGSAEALVQRADRLMYHAKQRGKNRVTADDRSEDLVALRAAALVPELGRAVERDEFVVHFQPIVDLRTGAPVAAEALLRWQHPRWGLLAPDEFLCAAETSSHMSAIGRRALLLACRDARRWSGAMANSAVHVNISGRQLEVGDLHADVVDALEKTGLGPDRLVLELTETHAGRAEDSARADLERLRTLGVRIAIDDVGTGFSGLVRILDLPIDILKIDKQFVRGLPADPRCEAIVKAILSMATSLRLTVIAEGIEKQDQCDELVHWGCALGQGFLFGRALPAVETPPSPAASGT